MQHICFITVYTDVSLRFLFAIKQIYMILCWCNCTKIFNQPQIYSYSGLLL